MNEERMLRLRGAVLVDADPGRRRCASAQSSEPIGLFAADVRVAFPEYKQTESVATALGVRHARPADGGLEAGLRRASLSTPQRGRDAAWRAELMMSHRNRTQETAEGTAGETVQTRFSSFSPQVSLNFGARQGWSYISGGLGWGHYTTELEAKPLPDPDGPVKVINYGGGALVRERSRRRLAGSALLRRPRAGGQPGPAGLPQDDDPDPQRRPCPEVGPTFRSGPAHAASRPRRHSSTRRAALPATECSDGCQPMARARGLRTS